MGATSVAEAVLPAFCESVALAASVPDDETFSTSVTVPTNTTSSCCNPWHVPAGAFEQVQADIWAGAKNKIGRIARSARPVIIDMLDILHGAAYGIERRREDFREMLQE